MTYESRPLARLSIDDTQELCLFRTPRGVKCQYYSLARPGEQAVPSGEGLLIPVDMVDQFVKAVQRVRSQKTPPNPLD
jgi:hypothetical protein